MNIRALATQEDREPAEYYLFENGWTMQREVPFPYYWILKDEAGRQKDRDKYRNDVIERHRLKIRTHTGS